MSETTLPERLTFTEEGSWEPSTSPIEDSDDEWIGTGWRVRTYIGELFYRHNDKTNVEQWLATNGYQDTGDGAHFQKVSNQ